MFIIKYFNAKNNDKILKIAKKRFMYHGAPLSSLPAILSEGLNFYTKFQYWNKQKTRLDMISRESFPGIYLTSDIQYAFDLGVNKSQSIPGFHYDVCVLVGIEIEDTTPSIVLDEDYLHMYSRINLIHILEDYFKQDLMRFRSKNIFLLGNLLQNYQKNPTEIEQLAKKYLHRFFFSGMFKNLKDKSEYTYELRQKINSLLPHVVELIKCLAEVLFSRYYQHSINEQNRKRINKIFPNLEKSHSSAIARYRSVVDTFLQKINFAFRTLSDYNNIRIKDAISYQGANKIVLVSTVHFNRDYYGYLMNIHYLSNPNILIDIISHIEKKSQYHTLIKDTSGKIYYDTRNKDNVNNKFDIIYPHVQEKATYKEITDAIRESTKNITKNRNSPLGKKVGCIFVRNHPEFGAQVLLRFSLKTEEEPRTWGAIFGDVQDPKEDEFESMVKIITKKLGKLPNFRKINQYTWYNPYNYYMYTIFILEVLPPDIYWMPGINIYSKHSVKWMSLDEAKSLSNLNFIIENMITNMNEKIFERPEDIARNLDLETKHAISAYIQNIKTANKSIGEKMLTLLLGLSPSLLGMFLTWLYKNEHITPQQVAQMASNDLREIRQKVEEYKKDVLESELLNEKQTPLEEQFYDKKELDTFEDILNMTLHLEGGYVNNPKDTGGETNYGITKKTYLKYLKDNKLPTHNLNMKNIPKQHIKDIYKRQYWDRIRGDQLPPKVARQLFDYAVHSGVDRASRALQKVLGVKVDGVIGQKTIQAVQSYVSKYGENSLAKILLNERVNFLKQLSKKNPTFKKGWINRIEKLKKYIQ